MIQKLKIINLGIRGVMETGIVAGLSYWGYVLGKTTGMKILLAILIPSIGFGFWGAVDFHQVSLNPELFRLIQEFNNFSLSSFGNLLYRSTFSWIAVDYYFYDSSCIIVFDG